MKAAKWFAPLGMVSALAYALHDILGSLLWPQYNPLTQTIDTLTASGAPNAVLLHVFTLIFGVCFVLFSFGMLLVAFHLYHTLVRVGCVILLLTSLVSIFGFNLFPEDTDASSISFQDSMHNFVNMVVILVVLTGIYCIAMGYLTRENQPWLGLISVIAAFGIAIFGVVYYIANVQSWPWPGLIERLSNYSFHVYVFTISFLYTFRYDVETGERLRRGSGK